MHVYVWECECVFAIVYVSEWMCVCVSMYVCEFMLVCLHLLVSLLRTNFEKLDIKLHD